MTGSFFLAITFEGSVHQPMLLMSCAHTEWAHHLTASLWGEIGKETLLPTACTWGNRAICALRPAETRSWLTQQHSHLPHITPASEETLNNASSQPPRARRTDRRTHGLRDPTPPTATLQEKVAAFPPLRPLQTRMSILINLQQ